MLHGIVFMLASSDVDIEAPTFSIQSLLVTDSTRGSISQLMYVGHDLRAKYLRCFLRRRSNFVFHSQLKPTDDEAEPWRNLYLTCKRKFFPTSKYFDTSSLSTPSYLTSIYFPSATTMRNVTVIGDPGQI